MNDKSKLVSSVAFPGRKMNFEGNPAHTFELIAWLEEKEGVSVSINRVAEDNYYTVDINHLDATTKTVSHYQYSNMFLGVALLGAAYEFVKNTPTKKEPSY